MHRLIETLLRSNRVRIQREALVIQTRVAENLKRLFHDPLRMVHRLGGKALRRQFSRATTLHACQLWDIVEYICESK